MAQPPLPTSLVGSQGAGPGVKGKDRKASNLEIRIVEYNDSDNKHRPSASVLSPTSPTDEILDYESEHPDDPIADINGDDEEAKAEYFPREHEIGTARAVTITHITPRPLPELPPFSSRSLLALPQLPDRRRPRGQSVRRERPSLAPPPSFKMPASNVPKPGPANLTKGSELPEWLEQAKRCRYLPEPVMKQLCEKVKECLMEGEFELGSLFGQPLLIYLRRVQYPAC